MPAHRPQERGFTILELVISLVIVVEILVAAGVVFDVHNKMARIQTQITDMQQSLRIANYDMVRVVRMAGRGGLLTPFVLNPGPPPRLIGGAVDVRNSVMDSDGTNQVALGTATPVAVEGTDILTLRGCFSTPLYQIDPGNGVDFQMVDATTADVLLSNPSRLGIPQCLRPLAELLPANGGPGLTGPMILGAKDDRSLFYVGQVIAVNSTSGDPMNCDAGAPASSISLRLDLQASTFSPAAFDPAMGPALVCMLEEYRYYVRDVEGAIGPDSVQIEQPRLARARMNPGTEAPYLGDANNLSLDLADGIFDLQVALGFDSDFPSTDPGTPGSFGDDNDNLGDDDVVFEGTTAAERVTDDWLHNVPADDAADVQWTAHRFPGNDVNPVDLLYVRLTLAARTTRPDTSYEAGDVDGDPNNGTDLLEDNDYQAAPAQTFNQGINRRFRRRVLQTTIDLRNLG